MENTLDGLEEVLEKNSRCVEEYDTEKGGIYLETTEDPRGWMLGDKTRKKYEATVSQISSLLNLQIMVIPNDDGSKIKVIVHNSEEIRMMLLSKNDDVGSSIEYAKIDVSKPTELTAKIGEHICLESLIKSGSIRSQIFPGMNIVDMVRKDDYCDFVNRLKTRELLEDLVGKYYEMEDEINVALSCLDRYGGICACKKPVGFKQIHEGEFDEIIVTCTLCGGVVDK